MFIQKYKWNKRIHYNRNTKSISKSSIIYNECLKEPEHKEYFHNMVQHQLEKKGLLSEIEKRDDVLVNTFKSSNPSHLNEINENRPTIHVIR